MSKIKPSLSKGTRDFLPQEVAKRNYIFDIIKSVFRKYGFEQIETPAIERLETLTGKYGEEGDKLLFKILNSGDYFSEIRNSKFEIRNLTSQEATTLISEKGLRYDLTVPLARYVVQHQDKLAFPFKRFHIGPVWRADRPQKGRYQEFYQCDADVIGSNSLLNEVELLQIYIEVFRLLRFDPQEPGQKLVVTINNRKILQGVIEYLDAQNLSSQFFTIIDKADKIGYDGVMSELSNVGFTQDQLTKLQHIFSQRQNVDRALDYFDVIFKDIELGRKGVDEIRYVLSHLNQVDRTNHVIYDILLARGLDYYTGLIVEVKILDAKVGSVGGGGRYDNLTEMFGGQNLSGVGISFGIERIYDVMEELNLFPETIAQGVKVLFVARNAEVEEFTFKQVQTLRDDDIPAEIFLGNVKKQKHFTYAEQKGIPFMVEIGENEMASGNFRLRNVKERKEEAAGLSIQDLKTKFI